MKVIMRLKGLAVLLLALAALVLLIPGGRLQAASGDTLRFVVYADSRGSYTPGKEINTAALHYINNQIVNLNPKPNLAFFLGDMATMAYDANGERLIGKT